MPERWDGRERRETNMSELTALQESLDQVRRSLKEQNDLRAAQNEAMAEQTRKLSEVEEKLPGFVNRRGFMLTVAVLIACGLLVAAVVGADRRTVERFEREAVATDMAFCALTNRTFGEINKNRASLRQAFDIAIRPRTNSTPQEVERLTKLRADLLATIDGDLPLIDCSGIGNGKVDFSLQDAIRNGTLPTPTTSPPG